jgi:hypothetical protein
MTAATVCLGGATGPVAAVGGDHDGLAFAVEVSFPDLPLHSVVDERTVPVE